MPRDVYLLSDGEGKRSRGGVGGRTGVRDYCVAILAEHAACFGLAMMAWAKVTQAEGNRAGRDASECRGRCLDPLKSWRTCRRGAGYRVEARSCMLGAICRRFGGWSVEKLEYWYGKLGLHYPCHGPMDTRES